MTEVRSIYVASSWRNTWQPMVVERLRADGFDVYDFRNPAPGDTGFSWKSVSDAEGPVDCEALARAIAHPVAQHGFAHDRRGMDSDACVLVLPCGRSAHLEAGWYMGAGKRVVVLVPPGERVEPELMYLLANVDPYKVLAPSVAHVAWLLRNPSFSWRLNPSLDAIVRGA